MAVDYAALAKKHGGSVFTSPAADEDELGRVNPEFPGQTAVSLDPRAAENRRIQFEKGLAEVGLSALINAVPGGQVARGAPWLLRALPGAARTAASYGSTLGADVAIDAAHGREPDLGSANSGALQAAGGQVFGEGLAGVWAPALARFNMGRALRPTPKMAMENPSLIDDALGVRLRVRGAGVDPVEAIKVRRRFGKQIGREVADAELNKPPVTYAEMSKRLTDLRREMVSLDPTDDGVKALDEFITKFHAKWGGGAKAGRVQGLKVKADRRAKAVHNAIRAGGSADDVTDVKGQAFKAVADDAREALEARAPGLRRANAMYNRARSLERAARRAPALQPGITETLTSLGGGGLGGAATGGGGLDKVLGGLATYTGTRFLNTPQMLSRQALLYSDPRFLYLLRNAPHLGSAALPDETRR